jgi:hypothetical protein
MKKYISRYTTFVIICFLFHNTAYSQSQGLIKYSFSSIHFNDSTKAEQTNWKEWMRIWFKDSCVIYEMRINYQTADQTPQGTVVKRSYPVWRYIYLDLRTMICQDYQNFKDTAKPFCNYSLKPTDYIGIWKFFAPKKNSDTLPGMTIISDTIINNSLFKRAKVLYKYYRETGNYFIYYLNCNVASNMFHLNRTLNEMFPGCKTIRIDLMESNGKVSARTEYEIFSDSLSAEDENLFKEWHKNSLKIQLPLLSYEEAMKSCIANYEHENPTITIEPLRR